MSRLSGLIDELERIISMSEPEEVSPKETNIYEEIFKIAEELGVREEKNNISSKEVVKSLNIKGKGMDNDYESRLNKLEKDVSEIKALLSLINLPRENVSVSNYVDNLIDIPHNSPVIEPAIEASTNISVSPSHIGVPPTETTRQRNNLISFDDEPEPDRRDQVSYILGIENITGGRIYIQPIPFFGSKHKIINFRIVSSSKARSFNRQGSKTEKKSDSSLRYNSDPSFKNRNLSEPSLKSKCNSESSLKSKNLSDSSSRSKVSSFSSYCSDKGEDLRNNLNEISSDVDMVGKRLSSGSSSSQSSSSSRKFSDNLYLDNIVLLNKISRKPSTLKILKKIGSESIEKDDPLVLAVSRFINTSCNLDTSLYTSSSDIVKSYNSFVDEDIKMLDWKMNIILGNLDIAYVKTSNNILWNIELLSSEQSLI